MSESGFEIMIFDDILDNQRLLNTYLYGLVSCKSMEELVILKILCLYPKVFPLYKKINTFTRGSKRSDN
jgi:hypothetical protein